jgi:CRP-like cAMP-binding protein
MKLAIGEVPCRNSSSCVLCDLSTDFWSWIEHQAPLQSVPPNNLLLSEGEQPSRVVMICSGVVQLYHSTSQGRAATLKLAHAGELLGFSEMLTQKPYDASAMTTEWCQLRIVKEGDFFHLLSASPELKGQMLTLVAKELCETRERLREFLLEGLRQLIDSFM